MWRAAACVMEGAGCSGVGGDRAVWDGSGAWKGAPGRGRAREGAGARRGVKRRSISKLGKSGRGKRARSAGGGMVLLSGAVGVGWALGVAQGVAAWPPLGAAGVCGETPVSHLKVAHWGFKGF